MKIHNLKPILLSILIYLTLIFFNCSNPKPETNQTKVLEENNSKIAKRTQESMYEVINKNITELSYCHEKELRRNPTRKGEVSISITINPAGEVIDMQVVNNSFFSKPLESCLMLFIKRLKFEQVMNEVGNISVTYPFIFE